MFGLAKCELPFLFLFENDITTCFFTTLTKKRNESYIRTLKSVKINKKITDFHQISDDFGIYIKEYLNREISLDMSMKYPFLLVSEDDIYDFFK